MQPENGIIILTQVAIFYLEGPLMYLNTIIETYLAFCQNQKKLSNKTIKAYSIDLKQFSIFIGNKICTDICKDSINHYITKLHGEYKPKSVKRKIAAAKAFFRYLEFEDIILVNPFDKITSKFIEPMSLPRTIPAATIEQILKLAYNNTKKETNTPYSKKIAIRNVAVLELLFSTGIRVSELCSIQISDMNLDNGQLRITGKGARERIIQVTNQEVISTLKNYIELFKNNPQDHKHFFTNKLNQRLSEQSVREIIKSFEIQLNLKQHITPHMFRHSFATLLLEEDVDIRYIQQILGHSTIVTTQIYTHVSLEKQKSVLINKHPRNKLHLNKG